MNLLRVIVNLFHFNRTNWKAVSLCFLAAVVFWFFNALNKNYSTNLRFGVNFDFDEQRYVPVEPLPRSVFMNVSGNGWDLLRKSLGFNLPDMNIPLERPTEVKKIVGSTLPALLAGQLGNLQINHVVTDTLYLSLDPREKKKVKVTVDPQQFAFAEGYGRLSPVVVLPDSISLEGPKSVLAQVPDSITLSFEQRAIDKDYREEVEVIVPYGELLRRDPAVVEVMFEVVEWVEVTKAVRLDVINVPPGVRANLVKDSVSCVIKVPRSQAQDFANASEGELAILNLKGVRRGDNKILPEVIGLPGHVRLIRVDSVSLRLY
ncbi:MAG: hypothetical protein AB7O48_17110 [Cyclobacteriaceae bacterium]